MLGYISLLSLLPQVMWFLSTKAQLLSQAMDIFNIYIHIFDFFRCQFNPSRKDQRRDFTRRQVFSSGYPDFNKPMWRTKSQTGTVGS